ncbi:hydantoinase/oxoprolinase family protein [Roseiarcaceae bacterium H3SJ34-1]|uniref:hydantoinase/oxoprolinase family protein n=1 Tax=Terripilifer ovatus TaxID=3032367 RepID=UPI003AB96FF3|nr:hydantoinase/oxoprolinase family protein [Roseiarcaceae bacterium H3SJ34-1]
MSVSGPRYRLGVDVGGTHTDLVLLDPADGALMVEKVSSTPKNPALGVLNGVSRFVARGVKPDDIAFFAHGTTITTNALLEMRGSSVGLMITKGFRAIQEVQAQARDGNLFDYFYEKPAPIAPQSLTREIPERSDYEGKVLLPLDHEAVRQAARELKEVGVRSIAVCYLFSFLNPSHEEETRRLILEEISDAHVSLSSEVLPRIREWARMSTTLLNAYLEPVLVHYIGHLNKGLDEAGVNTQQRFLMQSNGGVMPFSAAIAGGRTVHTLFSGPAGGAQASAHLSGTDAQSGLVTLDMGGTSADIAFIEGGAPLEVTEGMIARRQLDVPALDMTTISAGGGSIASVDGGGFLMVGPQSAGADPGPACYGRGGTRPTVTDADVACGYLNPDYFLGGAQKLDVEAARKALQVHIGDPLKMDVLQAAAGIRRIVDMRMADEVRVFAAKRGVDLTSYTLLPFGGAGAVHAAAVAEELNMQRILVPPRPGAFSALGLLCTDVVHDYIRSELKPLEDVTPEHAENIYAQLEAKALEELIAEGMQPENARYLRELDLRYTGQGYELRTPLDGLYEGKLSQASLTAARQRFDERHAQIHGHAAADRPVEVVSYRVRLRVAVPKYEPRETAPPAKPRAVADALKGGRTVYFDGKSPVETQVYERDGLDVGTSVKGPAIVEQFDATTIIPPGWAARVDTFHNLILEFART